MKQAHYYLLKNFGIHKLIAIKQHIHLYTGGYSNLYKRVNANLNYQLTKQEIAAELARHFEKVKEYTQYQ